MISKEFEVTLGQALKGLFKKKKREEDKAATLPEQNG